MYWLEFCKIAQYKYIYIGSGRYKTFLFTKQKQTIMSKYNNKRTVKKNFELKVEWVPV